MACDMASDMVRTILKARESQSDMIRERNKDPSFQDRNKYPIILPTIKEIHEMQLDKNGDWFYLASFTKPELPPEWLNLKGLPPGVQYALSGFIQAEYEKYVEEDPDDYPCFEFRG